MDPSDRPVDNYSQDSGSDWSKSTYGWSDLSKALTEFDDCKIKDCKEDIDTLLVFAGLFSAVLTAFIIESYTSLQPNPADTGSAVLLLERIASRLDSVFAGPLVPSNTTQDSFDATISFVPPPSAVRINALWFSSLVCSLVTASLGMLVKQWLREYSAGEYLSPQSRARIRHLRYSGLLQWKVFEISAMLPLLLQTALGLFLLGLTLFTLDINSLIGTIVAALVILWLTLTSASTIAPIFSSQCPYQTTFLKAIMNHLRACKLHCGRGRKITSMPFTASVDEAPDDSVDVDVVVSADVVLGDDEVLGTTLRGCFKQFTGVQVLQGVRRIIAHRLQIPIASSLRPSSLLGLTRRATRALADILVDALDREVDFQYSKAGVVQAWYPWMGEVLSCVLATPGYSASSLTTTLDRLLAQGDRITDEALVYLRDANDTFLSSTLRTCMGRLGNQQMVHSVRRAVVQPHHSKHCTLSSMAGRTSWAKLGWKTRCALSHILLDALDREVHTQVQQEGNVVRWGLWMNEALVALCALNHSTSGFTDLISRLLTQNPATACEVLTAFAYNRNHDAYLVYCGIRPCLTSSTAINSVIANLRCFIKEQGVTWATRNGEAKVNLALDPMLLCQVLIYIGCRCSISFAASKDLHASLRDIYSLMADHLEALRNEDTLIINAAEVATTCLSIIEEYGLASADHAAIVGVQLVSTLKRIRDESLRCHPQIAFESGNREAPVYAGTSLRHLTLRILRA